MNKTTLLLGNFTIVFCVTLLGCRPDTRTAQKNASLLEEKPTKPFSSEQILNNDMPGRKASPVVEEKFNAEGFARDHLYSVPAPGVHPRILFGPQDLPRIRKQLKETEIGRFQLDGKRKDLAQTMDKPGSWENDCYLALKNGDVEKFRTAYSGPKTKIKPGPPGTTSNPLVGVLQDKAFLALVDDDKAQSRDLAKATVALARILDAEVDAAAAGPDGKNFWRSIRKVVGDGASIGFLYDFTAPAMTPEEASVVRALLSKMTKGRYTFGMDLPGHWRNWNFIGLTLYYPLISLAIEGEEGYEPRIYERGVEVAHDYVTHAISEQGVGKEGIGYHSNGMTHTTLFALAMANRGDQILTMERYRLQAENWLVWAMQPYGGEWLSSGDLGTFSPNAELVQAFKFFYPQSTKVDYVFQNLPDLCYLAKGKPTLLQLLTSIDPSKTDHHAGADFKLGDSLYDPERGYLFMRDGWNKDAAYLQFAARCDTTFASHDFPDRGTFYFSALGRPWSLSGFRETEAKYQNTVMIDDRGEGYFATPATWLGVADAPLATFGAVDLKYCYDWRWLKPPMAFVDEEFAAQPRLEEYRDERDRLKSHSPQLKWERDPLPQVIAYYSGYLAGNPLMWDEDAWVVRAAQQPVQRAFRTAGLVRGKHPYALIIDDIQKDNQERAYRWQMMVPNDLEVTSLKGNDIILCPPTGQTRPFRISHDRWRNIGAPIPNKNTPQLLVRILDVNQPASPTFQSNPALESIELIKHDDLHQNYLRSTGLAKRLVLPSQSVAPDYKVLLYPFREGDPMPVTTWNADKTCLTIECGEQKDEYILTKTPEGRTALKLQRGTETVEIR